MLNTTEKKITPQIGFAYAAPVVPFVLLMFSNNVLSGLYAKHHDLTLAAISLAMLIAGMFDAITDPLIGYFSDRYHHRTGNRKPFFLAGGLLLIPSAWFLLSPGPGVTILYFLFWYLAFYLATTLFTIPHLAWAGEICPSSSDRSRIFAYRNYAQYAGFIIFMLLPMTPLTKGSDITPEVMRYLVLVAGLILLPTLYVCIRNVPSGAHRRTIARPLENPFFAVRALLKNKPMLLYLAGTVFFLFCPCL